MCHSCQAASPFLSCHCLFFNIWARATCRMRNARQLPGRMILTASAPAAPATAPCHSVACCAQTESGKYLISVRHLPGNDNALDVCICSAVAWLLVVAGLLVGCCLVGWQSDPCLVSGKLQLIYHTLFAHRHYYYCVCDLATAAHPAYLPPTFCNSTFGKRTSLLTRSSSHSQSNFIFWINFTPASKWSSLAWETHLHTRNSYGYAKI